MGLFSFLQKRPNREIANRQDAIEQSVNSLYETTKSLIQTGVSKPTASTGTPIENLKGASRITATLSNIGGGSKEVGGGGMAKGLETITKYAQVATVKKMIDQKKGIDK